MPDEPAKWKIFIDQESSFEPYCRNRTSHFGDVRIQCDVTGHSPLVHRQSFAILQVIRTIRVRFFRSTVATLHRWLAMVALAAAPLASAAYRVELEAPRAVRELLSSFLDLSRYRDRTDIDADQLDFMIAAAPAQVRKLLSTEGYFAAQTVVRIERGNRMAVVRVQVTPGR